MLRRSFLFAFILTLICTALFLVVAKKGIGLSIGISLILGVLGFFVLFAFIRSKFGGERLTKKVLGFELLTIAFSVLLFEIVMNIFIALTPRIIPEYAFASAELRQSYKNELDQANRAQTFEQYVMYKGVEFDGEFINQDKAGIRETWTPDFKDGIDVTNIYMFGGSTMWGFHARDDYTIPSYLAKYLHEHGIQASVTNHGVIRDSSSTEIVRLFQLLKAGHEIDLVIFYDGFNDLSSGVRGMSGRIKGYNRYKQIFLNSDNGFFQIKQGLEKVVRDYSALYHLLNLFARSADSLKSAPDTEYLNRLADDTTNSYLKSVGAIEQLSKSYGFKYAAFWQPMAFLEPFLTEEEQPRVDASNNVRIKFLVGPLVNERLPTGVLPNFFNISDALHDRDEPVYIDIGHLSERGNEIVAKKIGDILLGGDLLFATRSLRERAQDLAGLDLQ